MFLVYEAIFKNLFLIKFKLLFRVGFILLMIFMAFVVYNHIIHI
jgi:hypothetical protein